MTIVIQLSAPPELAQGIKESLAMYLERWGDARVVEVRAERMEQTAIWNTSCH